MHWSRRVWMCPYYRFDDRLKVKCDAGTIKFPDRYAIVKFADDYCGNLPGWEKCPLAMCMNDYFDRMEEEELRKKRAK